MHTKKTIRSQAILFPLALPRRFRTTCTVILERHLDGWLRQRIPEFDMERFMKTVAEREGE